MSRLSSTQWGVPLDEKRLVHCRDGRSASCTILQTIWHSACTHPCHSERSRGISKYFLWHGTITSESTSSQMSMTACSTLAWPVISRAESPSIVPERFQASPLITAVGNCFTTSPAQTCWMRLRVKNNSKTDRASKKWSWSPRWIRVGLTWRRRSSENC